MDDLKEKNKKVWPIALTMAAFLFAIFINLIASEVLKFKALSYFWFIVPLCILSGFIILIQFNQKTILLGLASMPFAFSYPLMKRFTYWPQLFLGITFNIGVLIAYSSITNTIDIEVIFLYLAGIFWTLGYDTIYAHQDREDDLKIGIKSTAILFDKNSKLWISTFYVVMLGFLIFYGIFSNVNLFYYVALIFVGLHLINQIIKLDINNSEICLKLFKSNSILGLLVCACLIVNIL